MGERVGEQTKAPEEGFVPSKRSRRRRLRTIDETMTGYFLQLLTKCLSFRKYGREVWRTDQGAGRGLRSIEEKPSSQVANDRRNNDWIFLQVLTKCLSFRK